MSFMPTQHIQTAFNYAAPALNLVAPAVSTTIKTAPALLQLTLVGGVASSALELFARSAEYTASKLSGGLLDRQIENLGRSMRQMGFRVPMFRDRGEDHHIPTHQIVDNLIKNLARLILLNTVMHRFLPETPRIIEKFSQFLGVNINYRSYTEYSSDGVASYRGAKALVVAGAAAATQYGSIIGKSLSAAAIVVSRNVSAAAIVVFNKLSIAAVVLSRKAGTAAIVVSRNVSAAAIVVFNKLSIAASAISNKAAIVTDAAVRNFSIAVDALSRNVSSGANVISEKISQASSAISARVFV